MSNLDNLYLDIAENCNQRDKSIRYTSWQNGRDLLTVRDALKPQGLWVAWCEKYLHFTYRTATNYINLYQEYPQYEMISYADITLATAYRVKKEVDTDKKNKREAIREKARNGEKLTDDDMTIVLDVENVNKPDLRAAYRAANELSPQTGRDIATTGAMTNLDGDDIPLSEADPTLIRIQAETEVYERKQRHIAHKTQGLQDAPVVVMQIGDKAYAVLQLDSDYPLGLLTNYIAKVPKAQPMEMTG
jgi:hypothetical protein